MGFLESSGEAFDVFLPDRLLQVGVVRFQRIEAGDRIVLFAAKDAVRKVEKFFSVQLEYF